MNVKKYLFGLLMMGMSSVASAQIMLSPIIDSAIDGLTENNVSIAEGRLRNIISSMGMESGYGGRFVLACKVAALQREVSGTKLIQHLEVTFAIGDNLSDACFGSTSVEVTGIGNSEGQAMTSALKNIKGNNPEIKRLVAESKERIISYYEKNGPAIIKRAQTLVAGQNWEEALYELTAIPQECSCYPQALKMMSEVYQANINHDAAQILAEAQAVWSADPNPGPAAEQAMAILGQIDTQAACYPQAKALMNKIEARVKSVTDQRYKDAVNLEKSRIATSAALEKARINACRDVAVAYARRKVTVVNNYHHWW